MSKASPSRSPAARRAQHALHRATDNARTAAYRAANRDALSAKAAVFRDANREAINDAARARVAALPPVVYAWVAPDGVADYVGRGTIERARMHGYRRKAWWTPQHMLVSMTCDSEWQAMEMEGRWGGRMTPRHNIEGYRHGRAQ